MADLPDDVRIGVENAINELPDVLMDQEWIDLVDDDEEEWEVHIDDIQ